MRFHSCWIYSFFVFFFKSILDRIIWLCAQLFFATWNLVCLFQQVYPTWSKKNIYKLYASKDFHANELNGCYWIYDRFFFQIGVWEWLNPYWLVAIQTLIIVAFIAELITVLILILYFLLYGQPAAESTIACGLQVHLRPLSFIKLVYYGSTLSWFDVLFLIWAKLLVSAPGNGIIVSQS